MLLILPRRTHTRQRIDAALPVEVHPDLYAQPALLPHRLRVHVPQTPSVPHRVRVQSHLLLERVEPPELDPEPERRVRRVLLALALALTCGLRLLVGSDGARASAVQLCRHRACGHEPEKVFCVPCGSRPSGVAQGLIGEKPVDIRRVPNTEGRIDRHRP